MRALLQPNGSGAAGWYGAWKYSWPRDTACISAAFAATGPLEEAHRIIEFNASTQRSDGTWEARTTLDGAGPPDGRRWQLDANGWVPWATWQWYQAAPKRARVGQLAALYPMVAKAADYTVASLDSRGLPPASPDYWEITTTTPNIGTAAPLLAGLNSAADLARESHRSADARRWSAAARRLAAGIAAEFAPNGYPRTVDNAHGRDSAVAFMAPPFNAAPADLAVALTDTYDVLVRPNGGVVPGNDPSHDWGVDTWTPSTSFFALAWAGTGQPTRSAEVLSWVTSHRNWLGELPEKVTGAGHPGSTVPLAWTDSIVLMTMAALDGDPLPTPRLHPGR
jgi:GH15 family glucan-1,4-alpha-glucosidase